MSGLIVDTKEVKRLAIELEGLGKGAPAAVAAAINRSMTYLKTQMSREVTKSYEIQSKFIKESLSSTKATPGNLQAKAISAGHSRSLTRFKVKPTKLPQLKDKKIAMRKKVQVKIKKGGGYKAVNVTPGAFLQTMNNATNIWKRKAKGKKYKGDFYVLRSLSVPQMIGNKKVIDELKEKAEDMLNKRLSHEIDYRTEKIKQKLEKGGV
jgi:hypothetical protein